MSYFGDNVYEDVNGAPGKALQGVKVYVYTQDGELAALADADDTPIANPVTTDASGAYSFYADDGLYRADFWANGRFLSRDNQIPVGVGLPLPNDVLAALVSPAGSSLVSFLRAATGAIVRSLADWLTDQPSIMDFIPLVERVKIRLRTSTADLSSYVAAAIAHINSLGGGSLYWPPGTYNVNSAQQVCRNLLMYGAGREATIIQGSHAGTAGANSVSIPSGSLFKNVETINGSHRSCITIRDMTLKLTNASNRGACFYSQCSTFLNFIDVFFNGGKYGLIRDQDEVSYELGCAFEAQTSIGLWYVNGADINPSALALFTNQLKTIACQFNEGSAYALVHDGGYDYLATGNNFNGGGIRIAGTQTCALIGGEYESVSGRAVLQVRTTTLSGGVSGSAYFSISGGIWASVAGQVAIDITGAAAFSLNNSPIFAVSNSGGVTSAITGMSTVGSFSTDDTAYNTYAALGVSVLDGYATLHYAARPPVRAEAGTSITGQLIHTGSIVRTTNGSAVTYTVPPNSGVAFEIGTQIYLIQAGAGKLTLAPGSGVTINAEGGNLSAKAQHTRLLLEKTATNTWSLSGDRIA